MLKNVEAWIVKTQETGLLDWDSLREAARKDIANRIDGGVCSGCLHPTHPGRKCSRLVVNEENPLDSGRPCGCNEGSQVWATFADMTLCERRKDG